MNHKDMWETLKSSSTYNIENFNLNTLEEAIQSYFYGREKPTYTEELQSKLCQVRKQIEDRETWDYSPKFEEAKEGDIFAIQTSYGWPEGTFPQVLYWDAHINLWVRPEEDTLENRFKMACLRKRK